ncbi:sialate O-acetylesterase [Flavisericum labens]|uniref:sialate O-acetylesterase n=1 Tax=Flavisericum labens TaxID=3377112 RepID=UPI00387B1297
MKLCIKPLFTLIFFIQSVNLFAIDPNGLFSDHMVLQQKVNIPVWGTGQNGEKVQIEFNGYILNTVVEKNHWHTLLPAMSAGGPYVMKITGDNSVVIQDIYIGEVWVCSGQSNMERKMSPHWKYQTITNYENEKKAANYPLIRQYYVPHKTSDIPIENTNGLWTVCSPETIESFSAVGYFFARDLFEAKTLPIGIILSAVGGTQAKYWTSRAGLSQNSELIALVNKYDEAVKTFPEKLAAYNAQKNALLAKYEHDKKMAKKAGEPQPRISKPPQDPNKRRHVSCYFNGMIAPLLKYPIKGVAWYQGESDRDFAKQYQVLFPALISDWRKHWNIGKFPFLFVQIAPFKENNPEIREAQLLTLQNTENTAMVVTTDCGDATDIHPPFKQPIGYRLSLAARALAYHENIAYSGPIVNSFSIKKNKVEIYFEHVYGGLEYSGNTLNGFTIANSSKNFVPAKAEIKGNKIIVHNNSIYNPVAVRYGWENVPKGNLYNTENLPASPFRTDIGD